MMDLEGHMHNGGDSVELILNDKTVCLSKAEYAIANSKSQGRSSIGGMRKRDGPGVVGEIISKIYKCTQPVAIKKGDRLKVKTNYDLENPPYST
jgi:hypothetical protein